MYSLTQTEVLQRLPQVLDNTILSTFRTCQHKALWEFVFGLTSSTPSVHLHAGGAFSRALETLYRNAYNGKASEALTRAHFDFDKAWGSFQPVGKTTKTKDRVWEAVESYANTYHPPSDYIEPSPLFGNPFEYSFAIPLEHSAWGVDFPNHPFTNQPFLYAGRFDMVGQHSSQLRLRDDKLNTQLGPNWEASWTLRSQFIGYVAAMQVLGYDVDTVEIRGVQPLVNSINHQTAVKTYSRVVVRRWLEQVQRDVRELVRVATAGDWSHNFADACSAYGGCPFLDLCRANDPTAYFHTFANRVWNPLDAHV